MATSADVARIAGVSLSTVSHVLNGTRPVREETRQRVLAAIEETNWEPDGVARSLRRARTDSVGVVVDDASQPAFAGMIRGIDMEASAAGLVVLLANTGSDPERELRSVSVLRERRVDGLLIAKGAIDDPRLIEQLRGLQSPVVLIDRIDEAEFDQVGVDNVPAMRALIGHLIETGHRRIALVTGDLTAATLRERAEGYRLALADAGLEVDPGRMVTLPEGPALNAAIRALLADGERPMTVVSSAVTLTVQVLRAAKELRLRIPQDLVLASFDTFAYSDLFAPQLTSVEQPALEIGQQAMRLLLRRMSDPERPVSTIRVPAAIVHGDSCGCPEPRSPILIP